MVVQDWNGRQVGAGRSRGGVLALAKVSDGLIEAESWPPSSVVQKLYRSRAEASFDGVDLETVTSDLGYYCDLQSIHSEDVITYNFFGTTGDRSTDVLNWLTDRLELPGGNNECEITLWRRIPHPDTLVSGGPELDAILIGDKTVIIVEAKWKSSEGKGQGKSGTKTQLQLRNEWFAKYGRQTFGDRRMVILGVTAYDDDMVLPEPDAQWIEMAMLTWRDLTECDPHPHVEEYARYYRWKVTHSQWRKRRGAPDVR